HAHFAAGGLQLAIASAPLLTVFALAGQLPKCPVVSPFERADTASRDDQRRAGVGRDGGLVNLAQVYRGVGCAEDYFHTMGAKRDVQLIAIAPDQLAGADGHWQIQR